MSDLPLCPFCNAGGEHLIIRDEPNLDHETVSKHVVCTVCGARALLDDTLSWQTRPGEDAAFNEGVEAYFKVIKEDAKKGNYWASIGTVKALAIAEGVKK